MAHEESEPKVEIIFGLTVGALLTLGALHFLFQWYFLHVKEEQQASAQNLDKPYSTLQRDKQREREAQALEQARVEQAMQQVARTLANPTPAAPAGSGAEADMSAVQGWAAAKHARTGRIVYVPAAAAPAADVVTAADGGAPAQDRAALPATDDVEPSPATGPAPQPVPAPAGGAGH